MHKILIFLFLLFSFSAFAKVDSLVVKIDNSIVVQKKFNKDNLEKYKVDEDFNYDREVRTEPNFFQKVFIWLSRLFMQLLEWVFGVKYAKGIFVNILKFIPYLIAGLILFLLFKFFLKVNSNSIISNGSNKPIVSLTEEEDLIKNIDLLELINKAIEKQNYRLAVRYYYLNILKQLELKSHINWEQQKTNEDYIKEITQQKIKSSFENLTRLYDFVWYGNFSINEKEFTQIELDFNRTSTLIQKKKFE